MKKQKKKAWMFKISWIKILMFLKNRKGYREFFENYYTQRQRGVCHRSLAEDRAQDRTLDAGADVAWGDNGSANIPRSNYLGG